MTVEKPTALEGSSKELQQNGNEDGHVNGTVPELATPKSKHSHHHHLRNKSNENGNGMFSPEIVNNAFNFKEDVLHQNEDDAESRQDLGSMSNESYDKTPIPIEEYHHDRSYSPHQTVPQNETYTAVPQTPSNQIEGEPSDAPTWLRRFSVKPLTSPDTYKWNEFKRAFKFGKQRKDSKSQPSRARGDAEKGDDSDEKARIRASNLITSFIAGAPAVFVAMASFKVDEHGVRRAPLLLSMIGIEVETIHKPNSRHKKYLLKLEYGVGRNRLKWSVIKDVRDFAGLHSRLKVSQFQAQNFKGERKIDLPRFPRQKFDDNTGPVNTLNDQYLSVNYGTAPKARPELSIPQNDRVTRPDQRSQSSESIWSNGSRDFLDHFNQALSKVSTHLHGEDAAAESDHPYVKKLERYLKQLTLLLSSRPEANKLFQFLELSPLGVLLSYENGYQGKQGYLFVGSTAKAQGWRVSHLKPSDFKQMVKRHTNKWFLVRSSYILYVSDIYSTTPLDVFLVDSKTTVTFGSGLDEKTTFNDNASLADDCISMVDDQQFSALRNNKMQTHFSIKLENGERTLKVLAKSENQSRLWIQSIESMIKQTIWSKRHRFNSFAPVRSNCFAQWLVDGRDHFWAVSSAMEMAKDVIYIHDWWLSPELYMRRPANGNQEFRLDRILKRKAEQGVKVFVIIYRNVGSTVVTDSLWTKHSLIDLHPNIHVIRSPNQWLQNTYFWAHHEKLCIIDHTVAFVGGIDLCYGRYDTPDHVLTDDSPHDFATKQDATEESIKYQKFPGKDYSNPRIKDFSSLDKPYESMYDRDVSPRMPWHDVHMMTAGQVASDLSRHFVQRWNYLLRQKRPSRPTPLLTPPPEFTDEDLERFNLTGTCEVQLLRSSGNWSLGLKQVERSIQEAYLKLIETSEHFVYMENQFFITSTSIDGTVVENRIGDALVDRIIRAHSEGKKWKAVIIIPLMPGFESQVDEAEGSAVRVIMQCQYMSISRGETSIYGKLKKMKINPEDYIQIFSLRKWGRIGPHRKIVTEQLYIHAKILLVDDRVALIGSANINERSQRGNRDSEVAAVVRDTETVSTTMDGEPYKAGKFCHTLRMRLMREHLGVDVDIVDIVEKRFNKLEQLAKATRTGVDSKTNEFKNKDFEVGSSMVELASRDVLSLPHGTNKWKSFKSNKKLNPDVDVDDFGFQRLNESDNKQNLPPHLQEKSHEPVTLFYHSFNNRAREENAGIRDNKQFSCDSRLVNNTEHKKDVRGEGADRMNTKEFKSYKIDASKTLKKWAKASMVNDSNEVFLPNFEQVLEFLEDDGFIDNPEALTNEEEIILYERNKERWELLKRVAYLQRVAAKQKIQTDEENAKRSKIGLPNVFTKVFHEKEKEIDAVSSVVAEKKAQSNGDSGIPIMESTLDNTEIGELPGDNIPVVSLDTEGIEELIDVFNNSNNTNFDKFIDPYCFNDPLIDSFYEEVWLNNAIRNTLIYREVFHCQPDDTVTTWKQYKEFSKLSTAFSLAQDQEVERREAMKANSSGGSFDKNGDLPENFNENRRHSIRLQDIKDSNATNDGILGKAPPTDSAVTDKSAQTNSGNAGAGSGAARRNRRGFNALKGSPLGSEIAFDRETADRLMSEVQGHLVAFPVDWLSKEIDSGNWFYNMDRLPPIEIYD